MSFQPTNRHLAIAGCAALAGAALFAAVAIFMSGGHSTAAGALPKPFIPRQSVRFGHVGAEVGPGHVTRVVRQHGNALALALAITPNRVLVPNHFRVRLTKAGRPVRGARVTARFTMVDMQMGTQIYPLPEVGNGVYARRAPALIMV